MDVELGDNFFGALRLNLEGLHSPHQFHDFVFSLLEMTPFFVEFVDSPHFVQSEQTAMELLAIVLDERRLEEL